MLTEIIATGYLGQRLHEGLKGQDEAVNPSPTLLPAPRTNKGKEKTEKVVENDENRQTEKKKLKTERKKKRLKKLEN